MADQRATLTLKLGGNEIRYEAEREAVEAKLDHVLDRLLGDVGAHGCAPAAGDVQVGLTDVRPASGAPGSSALPPVAPEVIETRQLEQLFKIAKGGRLRLLKLPARTADVLLLVLYGMRKLQGHNWVHAPGMTSAARASGARFDRADRLLAGYDDLVEGFGKRRAKRYRLTAAGREHCARLVDSLVGRPTAAELEPAAKPPAPAEDPDAIPKRVASKWDGELLTAAETARLLGVDEAEIGRLRHRGDLLGLPGGTRKRWRHFYPAFQIDAERGEIYPKVREFNRIVPFGSWHLAEWWTREEHELGERCPLDLIATAEADEMLRVFRAKFPRGVLSERYVDDRR